MALTFQGGLHVHDGKELTKNVPVRVAPVPELLTVPLTQHIGAPVKPLVKKKAEVRLGEPLGELTGFVSALVHSPVSGKVKDVKTIPNPMGGKVEAVLIVNDGEDTPFDGVGEETDPTSLDREALVERVKNAGIVGLGGATFPSHVKLSPPKEKPIDTIVVNGAECEPLLTCDYRLMMDSAETVIRGADLVRKMTGAKDLILAVEDNKRDTAAHFETVLKGMDLTDVSVGVAKTKYPQGGEKQLIKALLGREVPSPRKRGLPMDVGVVVHNVGTCHAIWEAASRNMPLVERLVTVVGDGVQEPGNFSARIGTPIGALLDEAKLTAEPAGVLLGGPMMGLSAFSTEVPVTKGTSGILVRAAMAPGEFRDCIRCGSCVTVCPARLTPLDLSVAAEVARWDMAEFYHVDDCIECGCCSYVCPSNRPIVQQIRHAKSRLWRIRSAKKE
ncbi:MAG: electron transport complex subunit RsxC [Planctomycetota bacterium]